jgi:hypothetical protein
MYFIHSHPKECEYGFWGLGLGIQPKPIPKNPKNLGKTQNSYPKTQIFCVFIQNPNFLGFYPKPKPTKPEKIWV